MKAVLREVAAQAFHRGPGRLGRLFRDQQRLRAALAEDEILKAALYSPIRFPVEGSRYKIGECLFEYLANGRLRRYKICGLQSGGLANVYTAIDLEEMKPYCLKENRALFGDPRKKDEDLLFEAGIAERFGSHPNLVKLHSLFQHRERICLVFEFVPGRSLNFHLKQGPLAVPQAFKYAMDICRAMNYARQRIPGFAHGDIKPGNCLISETGLLKLADFGQSSISPPVEGETEDQRKTGDRGGNFGGTYPYMAPELFDDGGINRQASDIYAFGITLFEMLTGTRPYRAQSRKSLVEMHRAGGAVQEAGKLAWSGVPVPVIALIKKCLSPVPQERPANFREIEKTLIDTAISFFPYDFQESELLDQDEDSATDLATAPVAANRLFFPTIVTQEQDPERAAADFWAVSVSSENVSNAARERAQKQMGTRSEVAAQYFEQKAEQSLQDHDSYNALYEEAVRLIARGDYREADHQLRRALFLRPDNPAALLLGGQLGFHLGHYRRSRGFYERAVRLDPYHKESYAELCRLSLAENRLKKAFQIAGRALSRGLESEIFYRARGDYLKSRGRFAEAAAAYKRVLLISRDPGIEQDLAGLLRRLAEKEKIGSADLKTIQERLRQGFDLLRPESIGETEGVIFIRKLFGDPLLPPGKTASLLNICFLDDILLECLSAVGGGGSGAQKELCEYLVKSIELAPARRLCFDIYYPVGKILYYLRRYDECERVFLGSLEKNGASQFAYYYLAACREIKGDLKASLKYYKAARRRSEKCDPMDSGICRVSANLKRQERRETDFSSPSKRD